MHDFHHGYMDAATRNQGLSGRFDYRTRKGTPEKDYYYRGDIGFYVNVFFYIAGGTFSVGFSAWLMMTGLGYW